VIIILLFGVVHRDHSYMKLVCLCFIYLLIEIFKVSQETETRRTPAPRE